MKYLYSGPISGVTLADGQEIMLFPGAEVDMPEQHDYTRMLLALQHLSPLPAEAAEPISPSAEQGA
ncbi:hypothetical protein JD974_17370 [Chromobacterium haemolyticum]|uniref:Uncharacterized protein n=1 Tax=Chromobacterium haemolyticum TaxID=394935 RepID=A0ABS3GS02_9NEIS|nr:hypothetical protein [Chromobacterium haemolyticum]MBK0416183.1 hypothetical protein [Chromobacterium haemolyticum]MBO0417379.1 hypothetical protein [Chromobacterium haemolyticum]MBO0500486.1 hypothetical protein [Chromobacterium haemolyticum]MDH0344670.1 hypothetical protein [Chromobacterium haemolyticum]QOD82862.1 hypothetical protein IEZ30_23925 [Chromobacterium haemolyticum]